MNEIIQGNKNLKLSDFLMRKKNANNTFQVRRQEASKEKFVSFENALWFVIKFCLHATIYLYDVCGKIQIKHKIS